MRVCKRCHRLLPNERFWVWRYTKNRRGRPTRDHGHLSVKCDTCRGPSHHAMHR